MAEPLEKYRSMRDFNRTQEPSGKAKVAEADRLRFVIQKQRPERLAVLIPADQLTDAFAASAIAAADHLLIDERAQRLRQGDIHRAHTGTIPRRLRRSELVADLGHDHGRAQRDLGLDELGR